MRGDRERNLARVSSRCDRHEEKSRFCCLPWSSYKDSYGFIGLNRVYIDHITYIYIWVIYIYVVYIYTYVYIYSLMYEMGHRWVITHWVITIHHLILDSWMGEFPQWISHWFCIGTTPKSTSHRQSMTSGQQKQEITRHILTCPFCSPKIVTLPPVYLSICLSVYLSIYLSVYLSIYLSIYLVFFFSFLFFSFLFFLSFFLYIYILYSSSPVFSFYGWFILEFSQLRKCREGEKKRWGPRSPLRTLAMLLVWAELRWS